MRLLVFLVGVGVQVASAQQGSPCAARQYRDFDFWIGTWNVTGAGGQLAGTNRIEKVLDGCALSESWTGSSGSRGQSLSSWSPGDNKWHQTWVDNEGTVLILSGGLINSEMVLEGERRLADGTRQLERITWTPNADGSVRQLWQASRDAGMRWTTVFDGVYRRNP